MSEDIVKLLTLSAGPCAGDTRVGVPVVGGRTSVKLFRLPGAGPGAVMTPWPPPGVGAITTTGPPGPGVGAR